MTKDYTQYYVPYDIQVSETENNIYRDSNIISNIFKLAQGVHKTILDTSGDYRGFWFIILYPILMFLCVIPRGLFYVVRELKKPKFDYEKEFKLTRNIQKDILNNDDVTTLNVQMREKTNTLKDKYNLNRNNKNYKANTINNLRKYLYSNKFTLKAKKLPNGCVTFYELNNDLNTIFPETIKVKKDFFSGITYIEDLNVEELEKKLKGLLQINLNVSIS